MAKNTLLFYHTHTADSNRFEREVRNLEISSHATDYVEVARRLPNGVNAVFVKTDHWKTDPEFFERLGSRFDGEIESFGSHVFFEVDGSKVAVINGVEIAVGVENNHYVVAGLPLDDEETYHVLSMDEAVELGKRAGWMAPAHVGMPFGRIPEGTLDEFFGRADKKDIKVALGYTTGYFPFYNRLSRNETPFRTSVTEYAEENGVPLLPELDSHAFLPERLTGCGVLEQEVIRKLDEGEMPVAEILSADLLSVDGVLQGISAVQFGRNYAAFLPLVEEDDDYSETFRRSLPDEKEIGSLSIPESTVELP